MQKKRRKGKLTGEDEEMKSYELVLNQSLGIFVLGDSIDKYLDLPHDFEPAEPLDPNNLAYEPYETYEFLEPEICVWVTSNKIDSIQCTVKCYWQGVNLIGMPYKDFLMLSRQNPDCEEQEILFGPGPRNQHQQVYTFYDLGLMLWVWRKKIRTVIIGPYEDE